VTNQFVSFLESNQLLPANQSDFQRSFSTETAITKFPSDRHDAVDRGDTATVVLLRRLRHT
jgi:hypothetical protein